MQVGSDDEWKSFAWLGIASFRSLDFGTGQVREIGDLNDWQELAMNEISRTAETLWNDDRASRWLGFELEGAAEGTARLSLVVREHHCNGHGILHGGITFSLADSAFAMACNSRNRRTVAQSISINYLVPGQLGDHLTAIAREVHLKGRSGIYDVTVARQDGVPIAEFRGLSRAISGKAANDAESRS